VLVLLVRLVQQAVATLELAAPAGPALLVVLVLLDKQVRQAALDQLAFQGFIKVMEVQTKHLLKLAIQELKDFLEMLEMHPYLVLHYLIWLAAMVVKEEQLEILVEQVIFPLKPQEEAVMVVVVVARAALEQPATALEELLDPQGLL
jgi:hypothetical protein